MRGDTVLGVARTATGEAVVVARWAGRAKDSFTAADGSLGGDVVEINIIVIDI
jgi:hypothetical protein